MFFDDVFTMSLKWLTEFCEKIAPTEYDLEMFLRADTASYKKAENDERFRLC